MYPYLTPSRARILAGTSLLVFGLAAAGCGGMGNPREDAARDTVPVVNQPDSPIVQPEANQPDSPVVQVDANEPDIPTVQPDANQPDSPIVPIDAAPVDGGTVSIDATSVDGGPVPIDAALLDGGGAGSSDGGAGPSCTSLVNPVFILTGDTQVPMVKAVGKTLRAQSNPTTLVWVATGSCSIINTLYSSGNITPNGFYIPSDPTWNATTGTVPTCTMPAGGVPPDLGIPIVFPAACSTSTPPAGLGAIKGPIQSFVFVVPSASVASAISAEEAYFVFGFGQPGGISPWTNEAFYFVRTASKGTQVSLGATIGVPAAKWKGKQFDKSTDVASGVATATAPDQAIGILGTEIYDSAANRAVLQSLTFQAYKQDLGYLPDSLASTFDKRNVRDGHYVAWSHVFYMTTVDGAGVPTNPRAKTLVDVFTGGPGASAVGIDTIALTSSYGLVPTCAMTVERTTEGGDLSVLAPSNPCGCAYEAAVGLAPAACVACTSDGGCTGARCLHGYCEAADGRTSLSDCSAPGADYPGIINSACTGRFTSPKLPMPALEQANGGTLPPLP
jgi:hypothetical protein